MRYRVMAFVGERLLKSTCAYEGAEQDCREVAHELNTAIEGATLRWVVVPDQG